MLLLISFACAKKCLQNWVAGLPVRVDHATKMTHSDNWAVDQCISMNNIFLVT